MYENLYGYTAPGADMPEYISINRVANGVTVTVRGTKQYGSTTSIILLDNDEFEQLKAALHPQPPTHPHPGPAR